MLERPKRIFRPTCDEVLKELCKIDEMGIIEVLPDLRPERRTRNVATALARHFVGAVP